MGRKVVQTRAGIGFPTGSRNRSPPKPAEAPRSPLFWVPIHSIDIYPPQQVQRSLLHPSQAPPARAYTVGSNGRPGVSMSRLLAGLQASLTVSVKVRPLALWFVSGLVCLFVRPVSLGYNAVWSCRFFRLQKSWSIRSALRFVAAGRIGATGRRRGSDRHRGSNRCRGSAPKSVCRLRLSV